MASLYDKIKENASAPVSGGSLYSKIQQAALPSQKIEAVLETPKLTQTFPSTLGVLAELQADPLSLKADPTKFLSAAKDSIVDVFSQYSGAATDFVSAFASKETAAAKVGKGLKLFAASAGVVFSPVTTLFQMAKTIPVLGSVAKLIEAPIVALGEGGANISGELLDTLPLQDAEKEKLREGVHEIGALAAQFAGIKVAAKTQAIIQSSKTSLIKRFGAQDAELIISKAQEIAKMAETPVTETLGRDPTPIEVSKLPPKMKMGEVRELAVARGFEVPEFGVEAKPKIVPRKVIEVPREQLPVRIEGAEKGISQLEARMKGIVEKENVKLAKREAESKGLDVSVYDKVSKPEQMRAAATFVEKTSQREVLEILEGRREAPKGLLNNAIMLALEAKSLRDSNVDLAIRLSSLRSTRMGQEISILTEVEGTSPVAGMSEIIRARRVVAEKKLKTGETLASKKTSTIGEISKETTNLRLSFNEAQKLLEKITC